MTNSLLKALVGCLAFSLISCSPPTHSESSAGSAPAAAPSANGAFTKRALLVGIDDYSAVTDLAGTGNDVDLMRRVLTSKLEYDPANIVVLRDAQATRDAILSAFRSHLIDLSQPGDHVFFHYSGHGSQMPDADGDEIDNQDETIVPHDARTPGVFDVSDDELNTLLAELATKTPNITVVLDSCHSGSATRGGSRVRQIPPDTRAPPAATWARSATAVGTSDFRQMGSNYVLITGAAPFELANETRINGEVFGIMTYNLANTLLTATSSSTFKDVMDLVATKVTTAYRSQHPQLEGTAPDRLIFGGQGISPSPYALVNPTAADRATVDHGSLHGLQVGQQLAVYSPGTKQFAGRAPTAQLTIEHADVFEAEGRVTQGTIAAASRTPVGAFLRGNYVLSVWVGANADPAGVLATAIEQDPGLRTSSDETDAQILVDKPDHRWHLTMGDLTALGTPLDNIEAVVTSLGRWANWFAVLNRSNPKPGGGVALRLQRDADPIGSLPPQEVEPGEILKYTVRNDSTDPLHITVIAMSTSGDIAPLYYSEAQRLAPGAETALKRIGTRLPDGVQESVDFIKVYAGKSKIDPAIFTAASVGSRTAFALDSIDWLTDTISYRLKANDTRAAGYVLVLDEATRATTRAGTSLRTVCRPGSSECIEGEPLSAEGDTLFISPGTRSLNTTTFAPGEAFQSAYDIGQQYGVRRVEPVFNVHLVDDELERQTRSAGGGDAHDPAAAADHGWSLKYVKAPQARAHLQALGKTPGAEARGVFIAHLDTGYRHHPETWAELAGERPVIPEWGIDLVGHDDDPFDELDDTGLLPNPGHGTASGSVIISPEGCQLEGAETPCVTGAGPGAQLVPVRVHTSVVVLNQRKLAEAIHAVVDKRIQGDPPLIAIAMGGPPSWSLWRAVKNAEGAGIAIIAAAGNNVKFVVWPARFKSTIAAGAINIRCQPWSGSSEGRAVDISAPGESVWRAGVVTDTGANVIGMSKGTTFATATTTGVAALWLSKHAGTTELAQLRQDGRLTGALRDALTSTAWRPGTHEPDGALCSDKRWNERRNGAGIVDAEALLNKPLTASRAAARTLEPATLDDLPLFSSLHDDDVAASAVRARYLKLLGSDALEAVAKFEVEVLFHYAANEQVRAALDQLVAGFTTDESYEIVRGRLLEQNLSSDLRGVLAKAQAI